MKLKLIFCVLVFAFFISACTLLKPECTSEQDCLEVACPGGTFIHEMCIEGKCKFTAGCPKLNCSAEGEIIPWEISKECCAGLHKIMQNIDSKSAGSVCTSEVCGDGKCVAPEGGINCPEDCKCTKEGETGSPNDISCCAGLTAYGNYEVDSNGQCIQVMEQSKNLVCINCGDGVCGAGENKCSCPKDCEQKPGPRFCGWETNASCTTTADCAAGGCSGQVCEGKNEGTITTCIYTDCYNARKYNASCACVIGKCNWVIKV